MVGWEWVVWVAVWVVWVVWVAAWVVEWVAAWVVEWAVEWAVVWAVVWVAWVATDLECRFAQLAQIFSVSSRIHNPPKNLCTPSLSELLTRTCDTKRASSPPHFNMNFRYD